MKQEKRKSGLARLPLGFFTKRASGDIKKVMSEDVERIELFVTHHIPDVTTAVVFPLMIMGYLVVMDWRPALVIALVFGVAVYLQAVMMLSPKNKKQYADYHAAMGRMNAGIVEHVRGIQVVKVFGRSMDSFERLKQDISTFRDFCIEMVPKFAFTYTGFLTLLSSTILFVIPAAVFLLIKAPSYAEYIPTVFLFLILGGGIFFPLLKFGRGCTSYGFAQSIKWDTSLIDLNKTSLIPFRSLQGIFAGIPIPLNFQNFYDPKSNIDDSLLLLQKPSVMDKSSSMREITPSLRRPRKGEH